MTMIFRYLKQNVWLASMLVVLLGYAPVQAQSRTDAARKAAIQQIITQLPAQNAGEFNTLNGRLVALGPDAWRALTHMLVPPGTGDDTYPRYALNGLAKYLTSSAKERPLRSFEQVLLEGLQSKSIQPSDKIFLMAQLELTGSNASIDELSSLLGDQRLGGPAARALTSIGTAQAFDAVWEALSDASPTQQATLLKTIGDAQRTGIADQLKRYLQSEHPPVKAAALYALAQTGDPDAASAFRNARFQADSWTAMDHTALRLRYARRLSEEGHHKESQNTCRQILGSQAPSSVKNEALSLLVDQQGTDALDAVIRAATGSDPKLRASALQGATHLGGTDVTNRWTLLLGKQSPAARADIIAMLGRRGDQKALPYVTGALTDQNQQVRLAAIDAAAQLGGPSVISNLLQALTNTHNAKEIAALKAALLRLPTDQVTSAVGDRLGQGSTPARVALLQLLEERRASGQAEAVLRQTDAEDATVRQAALGALKQVGTGQQLAAMADHLGQLQADNEQALMQQAMGAAAERSADPGQSQKVVLNALNQASGSQQALLLGVLPHLPASGTLKTVITNTKHSNAIVRSAAVQALANWPYAPAVHPLLTLLQQSSNAADRTVAAQGYGRLVRDLKFADFDKVARLDSALQASHSTDERAPLLDALSTVHTAGAVQLASRYFNDPGVGDQALHVAAHILASSSNQGTSLNAADVASAVTASLNGPGIHQKLQQYIAAERQKQEESRAFTSLFDGKDLSGWTGATDAYEVNNGMIEVKPNTHGNLFTEDTYSDFVFRFEFKLTPGANNGLGIRAPLEGDAAYRGMELQILDNTADKYANLHKYQFHGSIYGVVPAKRGALNPVGEWNSEEVTARGSRITVKLNGQTIVDADLDTVQAIDGREHPGLHRSSGHIGFLGHGDKVYFRNIRIKDLNAYAPTYASSGNSGRKMNEPPEGFHALFNGRNLDGWKGLVGNPETRAKMSAQELARKQVKADSIMRKHWSVRDGVLYFDGDGQSLTTDKDYGDFEMMVDWKIDPHGDSGIYLRGSPQVQIWDITEWPQGSGGLYNNQKHPSGPMVAADHPIGEWNHFRIKMIGDRVTVHLNGQLVVSNVVMENYWNRDKPIYPTGQIELQSHTTPLFFKNIFIREFPRTQSLFNGQDLSGWQRVGGQAGGWQASDGVLSTEGGGAEWKRGQGGGWLSTDKQYDNFKLEMDYRLPEGGNSGIFLRAPHEGDPAFAGMEIQLLDDDANPYRDLEPWQYTGSIYDVQAPSQDAHKQAGEWQHISIVCDGPKVHVTLNGQQIIDTNLIDHMDRVEKHPGLKRRKGYIGLQNHNTKIEFRNITIKELK